jgi:hypothetical protein
MELILRFEAKCPASNMMAVIGWNGPLNVAAIRKRKYSRVRCETAVHIHVQMSCIFNCGTVSACILHRNRTEKHIM